MGSNAKCNELMAWVSDALTRYVSNRKDEVSISVRLLIGEYLLLVKVKVKLTLEQDTKPQKGSKGIALLCL
jgi:hypothetical protein